MADPVGPSFAPSAAKRVLIAEALATGIMVTAASFHRGAGFPRPAVYLGLISVYGTLILIAPAAPAPVGAIGALIPVAVLVRPSDPSDPDSPSVGTLAIRALRGLGKGPFPAPGSQVARGGGGSPGAAQAPQTPATAGPPATGGPPAASSGLVPPLAGARPTIIGRPGQGTHSFSESPDNWQSDNAVDLAVPIGTPVLAPEAGVVMNAGWNALGGIRVTLRGASGREYYMAHLSRLRVIAGQRVEAGAVLGWSGDTGNARGTTPHLHLGVSSGDPLVLFGLG